MQDGVLPIGSFAITALETGTEYVADNVDIKTNTKVVKRSGKKGATTAQRVIVQDTSGSVDVQLADESTQAPEPQHSFGADLDNDGNTEGYMFTDSGRTYVSDDIHKSKCSIVGCVNPVIYIPATNRAPADQTGVTGTAITGFTLGAFLPKGATLAETSPWSATGMPAGITLNASTGALAGTPTAAGTYKVTAKCAATITVDEVTETRVGVRKFAWTVTAA